MNELKNMIKRYEKMFKSIKSEKDFEINLKFELEQLKKDFEYIEALTKYYINEKIHNEKYSVSFGKIRLIDNKVKFYLLIIKDYITILDVEKEI